jgi:hypothetical protein
MTKTITPVPEANKLVMLDLCSSHVEEEDFDLLEVEDKFAAASHEFGAFFYAGRDDFKDYSGYSESFQGVVEFAREHGYHWVSLDGSAAVLPELPENDW